MELAFEGCRLGWLPLVGEDAHLAGRALLARLCGAPLPPIRLTPLGKPYFDGDPRHFSISHTRRHVFCCLSDANVGVDAEEADREISPALARRYLSPAEYARWEAAPDRRIALLRLWILKEAYAKLTGKGIGNYLQTTDFDPQDPRITEIDGCLVAVLTEPERK